MKEKLCPLVEEYRRINSKPKQFQNIEEYQEVCTKLGALKIVFQRGCALNNQGQKLFQLGCALNQDIYGNTKLFFLKNYLNSQWSIKKALQNVTALEKFGCGFQYFLVYVNTEFF